MEATSFTQREAATATRREGGMVQVCRAEKGNKQRRVNISIHGLLCDKVLTPSIARNKRASVMSDIERQRRRQWGIGKDKEEGRKSRKGKTYEFG